ncbi:MAG TPA: asparagine synthase-related protein [Terriglobales bacterium]|nr:asparagine synthase-related protein [Terriglobales bacterium]
MSGICGVWRADNAARVAGTLSSVGHGLCLTPEERVEQVAASGAGVAAAVRFGTQQVYGDGNVLVACDADLDNEAELAAQAAGMARGPENARTAALLAALYRRLGSTFVEKLSGNFSFVLWDQQERRLLAAVDGFGVNRLVYFQNGRLLAVASRIDALLRTGEVAAEVNPRAIANFMNFGVNLAPETVFEKVRRLAPGTILIASERSTRVEPYWDMRYRVGADTNEHALAGQLESVVADAVTAQVRHDDFGSLGAFLSGGTDSSTVVGMMSRLGRGPAKTFSIGFEDERFNELGYAAITARKFQANHHTYLVNPADCFEALPGMVRFFDEPFANSSAIPVYFCARLAAQNGVRTLLGGDGGDELFGGNERYQTDKIFQAYQNVPRPLRKGLIEPVLALLPMERGPLGKARRYVRRSNIPPVERFFSYNFLLTHAAQEVFETDFLESLRGYSVLETPSRYYEQAAAQDHLDRLLYIDVKITLGDSDLPKVTQMAEMAGIQTRFPFLARPVAELSGRIPAHLKVKGFEKRYLFKQAFRNLLPEEVLRKKKHGFGIPVASWLKSDPRLREFSHDILFSSRAMRRGYFRRSFLEELIALHEADDTSYYGDNVWSFLILEMWHRQFVDQPVETAV